MKIVLAAFFVMAVYSCGSSNNGEVKAEEFGEQWPFVVDNVKLRCTDGLRILDVGGVRYALNGKAMRSGLNAPPDHLFKNSEIKSLGKFTEMAGAMCIQ